MMAKKRKINTRKVAEENIERGRLAVQECYKLLLLEKYDSRTTEAHIPGYDIEEFLRKAFAKAVYEDPSLIFAIREWLWSTPVETYKDWMTEAYSIGWEDVLDSLDFNFGGTDG